MGFVGIRTGSNTSGTRNLQPWLIESNYKQVILHLGGIYDKKLYDDNGRIEYVSRRAMPKRSVTNRVGAQSSSFGSYNSQRERDGLVGNTPHVYYKNSLGYASKTDDVAGQTVAYNAGLFQNGSYIVLKRTLDENNETDYWTLGVIERADLSVTSDDIVIGYVKNSFVTQIWQSDILVGGATTSSSGGDHPFKVKPVGEVEGITIYEVVPGTINNFVPYNISDTISSGGTDQYVYLQAVTDVGESDTYVVTAAITTDSNPNKPSTDSDGYLKLAKIRADGTVEQYVQGSVWSERHKYTEPDSATYYYYRV